MPAPARVCLLGFSHFERETIATCLRLARGGGAYVLVGLDEDSDLQIADADDAMSVQLVVATERLDRTLFVGSEAPPGAVAWMLRPIDPLNLLRGLDALVDATPGAPAADPVDVDSTPKAARPAAAGETAVDVQVDVDADADVQEHAVGDGKADGNADGNADGEVTAESIAELVATAIAEFDIIEPRPWRTPAPKPRVMPAPQTRLTPDPEPEPHPAPEPVSRQVAPEVPQRTSESTPEPTPELTPEPPLDQAPDQAPEQVPEAARAPTPTPALSPPQAPFVPTSDADRRPSALLVDDSAVALRFLQSCLLRWGLETDCVRNSGDALARIADRDYDFVFIDVELGDDSELDGLALCREMKNGRPLAETQFVLVSAHQSELDRVRGALAGCDAYLGKPLNRPDLDRLLQRHGLRLLPRAAVVG